MTRQTWKTAAEAMAEFEKDPAFVERRRQREEALQRTQEAYARAEAPVVEELRRAGVPIQSVWDLVNAPNTYAESLPILVEHLRRPYPDAIREGIARALAVPTARFAWPVLASQYREEQGPQTQQGLAVALANIADDSTLNELISLAKDTRLGGSRVLLLLALEHSRLPQARKALMDLGSDPQLYKEVQRILRRLNRASRKRKPRE